MNSSNTSLRFHVAIPARYASTRLPGKPLCQIDGKTMICHVLENAARSGAADVVVATDDGRIVDEVERNGGVAMMTASTHRSGTDRIAEVAQARGWLDSDIVVNLQGDEPGVGPDLIRLVAQALQMNPDAGIATLATPVVQMNDVFNPNVVKVVTGENGRALYFSRAPIPWVRDAFAAGEVMNGAIPEGVVFLRHIGLYAYRAGALKQIAAAPGAPIEIAESLEQLRAMSMGIAIHVTVIAEAPGHGVDTEADLARLQTGNSSRT